MPKQQSERDMDTAFNQLAAVSAAHGKPVDAKPSKPAAAHTATAQNTINRIARAAKKLAEQGRDVTRTALIREGVTPQELDMHGDAAIARLKSRHPRLAADIANRPA